MLELKDKPALKSGWSTRTVPQKKGVIAYTVLTVRAIVLTVLAVVAIVALLELIFSLAHVGEDTVAHPDSLIGYSHIRNHSVTFRSEGYSRSHVNAIGFRDAMYPVPKPAGTKRVCIVGDSMTMGLEVPLKSTFSKVLERRLKGEGKKVDVINCGFTGSGTGQQYLGYLRDISPLQPDMLIVAYHLGDTDDNVGGGTNPPRPTFSLNSNNKLQVNLNEIDTFLASPDARYYSALDWLRRDSHVAGVLTKLDLDLHGDPTYKAITRIVGKPIGFLWNSYLKTLPVGDWHIAESKQVAHELLPENAAASREVAPASSAAIAANKQAAAKSAVKTTAAPFAPQSPEQKLAAIQSAERLKQANLKQQAKAAADAAKFQAMLDRPENGDLKAYRSMLYVHMNRFAVTKEIFRMLHRDCAKNHCKLVIVGLPAYDNVLMYYRELNELQQFSNQEHIKFINTCSAYPSRGPLDDSDYHFSTHFNEAGHAKMAEQLYNGLFSASASSPW